MKYEKLFTKYKFIERELIIIKKIYKKELSELEEFLDSLPELERKLLFQFVGTLARRG